MTPHGVDPSAWAAVVVEDVPPPGSDDREHPMTTDTFDPEAIAARVAAREQQRPKPVAPTSPLARNLGSTVGGTGEAHGLPVPTQPVHQVDEDPIDRMERLRAEKQVRSPFGPPDARTPVPVSKRRRAAWDDVDHYRAPDLDDEDLADDEPPSETPAPRPSTTDRTPRPAAGDDTTGQERPGEPAHDPRCGSTVTGGGAPRGWVLIRIIGQGQPHRYCSPACAIAELDDAPWPGDTAEPPIPAVVVRPDGSSHLVADRDREVRRVQRTRSSTDMDDFVRRYKTGETLPHIARELGLALTTVKARARRATTLGLITPRGKGSAGQATLDRLAPTGATVRDVKAWGVANGVIPEIARGLPPSHLVDAYLAAHQNGAST